MNDLKESPPDFLPYNYNSRNFQASCRRAGTAPEKHKSQKNHAAKEGPIHLGYAEKAGSGDVGTHLEGSVPQGLAYGWISSSS
jgi:hypothetical protein